jgi:hypothetical protein
MSDQFLMLLEVKRQNHVQPGENPMIQKLVLKKLSERGKQDKLSVGDACICAIQIKRRPACTVESVLEEDFEGEWVHLRTMTECLDSEQRRDICVRNHGGAIKKQLQSRQFLKDSRAGLERPSKVRVLRTMVRETKTQTYIRDIKT